MQPPTERRIARRVPARWQVHFIHEGEYQPSVSEDVSIDGMYLRTEEPPASGNHMIVNFRLDGIGEIEAETQVVRVQPRERDWGVAVRFIDLPPAARKRIYSFVGEHLASLDQ